MSQPGDGGGDDRNPEGLVQFGDVHEHCLEDERTGQFHGRSLQHRPAQRVEAAEPEPPVPGVEVGEAQRPHGSGKILSRDGGGELGRDEDGGGRDAAASADYFLHRPAWVTVGGAQREQVDARDREAEGERGPRLELRRVPEQLELVAAGAQLERGRGFQQDAPDNSAAEARGGPPARAAQKHRAAQQPHGHAQLPRGRAQLPDGRAQLVHVPALTSPDEGQRPLSCKGKIEELVVRRCARAELRDHLCLHCVNRN